MLSAGDQERLQSGHHRVAWMELIVHLRTVWTRVRLTGETLTIRQDYGKRTAEQEEVRHVKVEMRVDDLVLD